MNEKLITEYNHLEMMWTSRKDLIEQIRQFRDMNPKHNNGELKFTAKSSVHWQQLNQKLKDIGADIKEFQRHVWKLEAHYAKNDVQD